MTGHYRQPADWNDEVVAESRKTLDRLSGALRELADVEPTPGVTAPDASIAALEAYLHTSTAPAALFATARATTTAHHGTGNAPTQAPHPRRARSKCKRVGKGG